MRIDRFIKMAELLEEDAANPEGVKFDLGLWVVPADSPNNFESYPIDTTSVEVDCGTAACGWGLAAISGIFKDEGVGFHIIKESSRGTVGMLVPTFDGKEGLTSAQAFFEVDKSIISKLFDTPTYDTTKGADAERFVAQRIRYLIQNGSLPTAVLSTMGGPSIPRWTYDD